MSKRQEAGGRSAHEHKAGVRMSARREGGVGMFRTNMGMTGG